MIYLILADVGNLSRELVWIGTVIFASQDDPPTAMICQSADFLRKLCFPNVIVYRKGSLELDIQVFILKSEGLVEIGW